jgi:predicted enzyme related to lactoylglutathione lyase
MVELVGFEPTNRGTIAELPWGLLATFSDPDGNNFSLLQPPAK